MIQLKNTADFKHNGVKVLVYGEAGMGKTTLIATAPNPVIFSAESGLLSLAGMQLPFEKIDTLAKLNEAYQWCLSSHEARQFETVCIDSLTEIAELVLANAMKQVKDPRQAYGELLEKVMFTVRCFRDLPNKNVYMTAQEMSKKDEVTGIMMNLPSMPGTKLGPKLPYHFDEVFRMRIGKLPDGQDYRFLQTQPDFNSVAKDRSGRLLPIEKPHLGELFAKITNGGTHGST